MIQKAKPAAVYRLFDADGTLLYVGSSYKPSDRLKRHRNEPWGHRIKRVDEFWYPHRIAAYDAESAAIRTEKPEQNVMGSQAYRDECRRRAAEDPEYRARILAGARAAVGGAS